MEIAIVDLGLGNLCSVEKAVAHAAERAGLPAPILTHDPDVIARAARLVVPGQGAFRDGAAALARDGGALGEAIRASIARGAPYFGICLGLQLLLETSDEAPGARGLGIFEGNVARIPDGRTHEGRILKVPHMGWNQAVVGSTAGGRQAADAIPDGAWFYFVHSYHALPKDRSIVAATADYGGLPITASIAHGPLLSTQFHPEKSQKAGLALLEAFLRRPV
jgi:glutamine amidotransferase